MCASTQTRDAIRHPQTNAPARSRPPAFPDGLPRGVSLPSLSRWVLVGLFLWHVCAFWWQFCCFRRFVKPGAEGCLEPSRRAPGTGDDQLCTENVGTRDHPSLGSPLQRVADVKMV